MCRGQGEKGYFHGAPKDWNCVAAALRSETLLDKKVSNLIETTAKEVVAQNKSTDWKSEMKRFAVIQRMRKILQNFTVGCVNIHKNDPVSEDVSEDHVFAWFLRVALDYWSRHRDRETSNKLSSLFEVPESIWFKNILFQRYKKI